MVQNKHRSRRMIHSKDAPLAVPRAQCAPWSAALARFILLPSPSAHNGRGQSGETPGCHQSSRTMGLGRWHDHAHWAAWAMRVHLPEPSFYRIISTPKLLGSGRPMEIFTEVHGRRWHQCQPLLAPNIPLWCPQGCPLGAAAGVSHPAWYRSSLVRQAVIQAVASPRGTPVAGGSPASMGQVIEALCPSSTFCSPWGQWGELQTATEHGVTL